MLRDTPPSWAESLLGLLVCSSEDTCLPFAEQVDADVPFAHALQPVVQNAWRRLEHRAVEAGLTDSAMSDLRRLLLLRLSELLSRPLGWLFAGNRTLADIAFARLADGRPAGSSTAKYEDFCNLLSQSGFGPLLREFPVSGWLISTAITNWSDSTNEFLDRLSADRQQIEHTFGIPNGTPIATLTGGLSDPHRGGRSVVIVGFSGDHHLVYKPRPVEIEARFHEFVGDISASLPTDPLRHLRVLPADGYGYVEHVCARAASGYEELAAFYVNAGRLLALLYLLGATDCHWENMIAAGDQLLLVDAETLFEGTPAAAESAETGTRPDTSHGIEHSVLRTGMLPMWISVGPARAVDVSALGAPTSERFSQPSPSWCFTNTDDMVWGDRRNDVAAPQCLPVKGGQANPLNAHGNELVSGFEEVLRALAQPTARAALRRRIDTFRGVRRRVVVRPTRTYAISQFNALEPDALRDADERALRLETLARAYVGEKERPRTWPILQCELAALEDLDIPYFEGLVGNPDLFVGSDVVVHGYYQDEGLQGSLERLDRLSDAERSWQVSLIHGALAAHRFEMSPPANAGSRNLQRSGAPGRHSAYDVAHLIAADAIEDPSGRLTWLTVALLADATRVQLGLVPPGLYDGRAGMAAFLYDCGETNLAKDVIRPVLEMIDHPDDVQLVRYLRNIGMGMSGAGGLLRLFQYRRDVDEEIGSWDQRSSRVVGLLSDELLAADSSCDLVSGLAGLAAPVARMHARTPAEESGRVLSTIGRLLLDRQRDSGGWALAPGHPALVGLSHGASGIAVGLGEIATVLDETTYADAAERAVDFEAALFDPVARNWPDLRLGLDPDYRFAMRSWCHGSVGIALARLRMIELAAAQSWAKRLASDLTEAVESSISAPIGAVDHLCCGNIGRATVVRFAGEVTGNARWRQEGKRLGDAVVTAAGGSPDNYQLLLGIDGKLGLRLPGLMTGLAGIGMHLLHGSDMRWVRYLLL